MGLSKTQAFEIQKASKFASQVLPERFPGELAIKLADFENPSLAKIRAAQVLLSLLSNNHKSLQTYQPLSELRAWMMEIPPSLLALIVQRKDPVATALIEWLLDWILRHSYKDLFQRLLDAGIDKTHFTGVKGGRLLLNTIVHARLDMILTILKENPDLSVTDDGDYSVVDRAARGAKHNVLQALLDQGVDFGKETKDPAHSPLVEAHFYNPENLAWFLDHGVDIKTLDVFIGTYVNIPSYESCNVLWKRFPKRWHKVTSCLLVYSAIPGVDEFTQKVGELKEFYDNTKSIVEEAFCFAMDTLVEDDDFSAYYSYYIEIREESGVPVGSEEDMCSDILDVFLEYGVDPNATSQSDCPPPVVSAIRLWDIEDICRLLDHGANINVQGMRDALFLNINPKRSFSTLWYIVFERGISIDMNKRLKDGRYPLQCVCDIHQEDQGIELVKYFVQNGSDINSRLSRKENYSALHFAVRHGRLETVRYLIENGAKLSGWPKKASKTLFELCVERCPNGCRPKSVNQEEKERRDIFKLLLKHKAEANNILGLLQIDLGSSLTGAIDLYPNSSLVNTIMKSGMSLCGSAMLESRNSGPYSPLQLAIMRGDFETTQMLINRGLNINAPAGEVGGSTALQMACRSEPLPVDMKMVQYLLRLGADVNSPPATTGGRTALQIACTHDEINFDLINLLLQNDADINAAAADTKGITALQGAAINGNLELVLFLLERGAQVDAPGAIEDGRTALEGAAEHGRLNVVQVLLNAHLAIGATPELETPLEFAEKEGHLGVVQLLKGFSDGWFDILSFT
jgi:ankyrin repeat protein